ncbi:MAG: hypothetical protein C5B48_14510 [Candidatus Rokuibacteriota bacterium]|nr:MAG: hypothetical protein C5B48_14510 [Candidatus Rokubacteria bacterium]
MIVHTPPAAEEIEQVAGIEASVIPHPVPDDAIQLPRSEARRRLGLPSDRRVLAAVGFIRPYKGYGLLADVWDDLGESAPTLLVMGELLGSEEEPVLERLRRLVRADVREGYASHWEFSLAVAAADAILLPYAVASDSGILHLARAIGTPVIASDAPQLAAAVTSTGAGIVLPRSVAYWREAVTGALPPPPPPPPPLATVAEAHLALYDEVLSSRRPTRRRPRSGALRLATYTDATQLGGAEHSLSSLLEALSEDIELTIVGVDRQVTERLAAGRSPAQTLVLSPVRDKRDLRPLIEHVRAMRRLRPDILHVNQRHPWSCQYGILAGLLAPGTKVVAVEQLPVPAANARQRLIRKFLSRRLAAHVGVSATSAREAERFVGLPRGSVRTIYNGVDAVDATETPVRIVSGPVVGAAARCSEQKGLDVFLRALAELPDVSGVLIGDGELRPELERLAEALELGRRVTFTGWREDARGLIAAFDVLAVPSRYEGFPLVALEGMSAGVPVIASAVGGLVEAIEDGETGILVPPDDVEALRAALARLLEDPDERARLGARARERVSSRFSAASMARGFECLYGQVLR